MRLFLIVDETRFFHPDFIADLVRNTKDEIVGVALITQIPPKNNISTYLMKHWYYLRPSEHVKLVFRAIVLALKDLVLKKTRDGRFYSVKSVLRFFNIEFFEVKNNINQEDYLSRVASKTPDVILSSCSLIFGSRLLEIPRLCCINRHSGLLPNNGGLWPVFQAYRKGEPKTGVSVHTMEKKIDAGIVLAQHTIEFDQNETLYQTYAKCFASSAAVVLEALDKIRTNKMEPYKTAATPSYYSFPTKAHWSDFRRHQGKFA